MNLSQAVKRSKTKPISNLLAKVQTLPIYNRGQFLAMDSNPSFSTYTIRLICDAMVAISLILKTPRSNDSTYRSIRSIIEEFNSANQANGNQIGGSMRDGNFSILVYRNGELVYSILVD